MITDRRLKKNVLEELEWDPSIDGRRIGVEVDDGIVTLSGRLESPADRDAMLVAVCMVPGVRNVIDLTVVGRGRDPGMPMRGIASRVLRM